MLIAGDVAYNLKSLRECIAHPTDKTIYEALYVVLSMGAMVRTGDLFFDVQCGGCMRIFAPSVPTAFRSKTSTFGRLRRSYRCCSA